MDAPWPAFPDQTLPGGGASRGLDLMPIPVANLLLSRGSLTVEASNRACSDVGLVSSQHRSGLPLALEKRVLGFLESADTRTEFDWSSSEAIDARHYRVALARTDASVADRCVLSFVDHTAQERTERSLRREMSMDSLTGLPNRAGFGDLLDQAVANALPLAVLVVDLARFGQINACLGGLCGDELLISVARRIKGTLRARDALGRIGGDEFGILLGLDEPGEAEHVAERLRATLATPFRLSDYEIRVEASVGIARGDGGSDGETLIRHAQFATKRAKDSGRTEAYENQAFSAARARFAMETSLRRAIENGDLVHRYQPICDLATGRVIAFEALARWRDESGRDVPPCEFIPVAEESGLIVPLGRWAVEEATRTLARWDATMDGDCGVQMAVNLSPIQLSRDLVATVVERALSEASLPGRRLKLELTESTLVADPERTAGTLQALKGLGVTLAMDDFGTGYSNLAYLQMLPIDILKIDRSFVTGMLADRDKVAIVRAVLGLAQALGMRTVAEGIETVELAGTLAALGCHFGQGFHFARPLLADDAYAMIAPVPLSATA